MNQTINIIKSRRSIRKFKDKKVAEEHIQLLIDCAMSAPAAHDSAPFEFIVVDDEKTIQTLLSKRFQMKTPPINSIFLNAFFAI